MFRLLSLLTLIISIVIYNYRITEPAVPNFEHFYELQISKTNAIKHFIKNMTNHAVNGYLDYAYPYDALDPISGNGVSWSYSGSTSMLTLFDMLDTLYILKLPQYQRAREYVVNFNFAGHVNSFEFIAKVLGGLISMYDLTQDPIYLDKANYIGHVFCNYTLLPPRVVDFATNSSNGQQFMSLSFVGSRQLEMSRLSQITKNPVFFEKALAVYDLILNNELEYPGLFPSTIDKDGNIHFYDLYGAGAGLDSFYEYLLKVGVHSKDRDLLRKAEISLNAIITNLRRDYDGFTFIATDVHIEQYDRGTLEHLTCFMGGLFALASTIYKNATFLEFGENVADGCYHNYLNNPTRLGPAESLAFVPLTNKEQYRLASELVETNFYLFRLTGKLIYKQRNYEIAQQIDKYCKTPYGYIGVNVITGKQMEHEESLWLNWIKISYYTLLKYTIGTNTWDLNEYMYTAQDSGFLSKTLKYLFLTFDEQIDLSKWIFNTQGHPFKMNNK